MTIKEILTIQKSVLDIVNHTVEISTTGQRLQLENKLRAYFEDLLIKNSEVKHV